MRSTVGITTDLESIKRHCEKVFNAVSNWTILGSFNSKEEAKSYEDFYAVQAECEAHNRDNSDNPDAVWHVYVFDYVEKQELVKK